MSTSSAGLWPKVIRHRPFLTGIEVMAREAILWPCHAFEVSIPIEDKGPLNILEQTLLKLSVVFSCDTKVLAQSTCLDPEVVGFIQHRLHHLGLLNERFLPTAHAKALLAQWDEKEIEYQSATVFMELLSGHLLPIVDIQPLSFEWVRGQSEDGQRLQYEWGAKGDKKQVNARLLAQHPAHLSNTPQAETVVKTLRAFKALNQRFNALTGDYQGLPNFSYNAAAITVMPQPTLVHLACEVILQAGSDDLLVSDPFGYGCSTVFKRALDLLDESWLRDIKRKALKLKFKTPKQNKKTAVLGFNQHIDAYLNIKRNLNAAQHALQKAQAIEVTSDYQKVAQKEQMQRTIKALYEVIEWTFSHLIFDYPAEHWHQAFSTQTEQNNRTLLLALAEKNGFDLSTFEPQYFNVSGAKMERMKNGSVELQSLLALSIAGASEDNCHPMINLAASDPACLTFIFELKQLRDAVSHGDKLSGKKHLNVNALGEIKNRVWRLVWALYPQVKDDESGQKGNAASDISDINQQMLAARVSLEQFFGLIEVKLLSVRLFDSLRKVELLYAQLSQNDVVKAFITALAASLEVALIEAIGKGNQGFKDGRNIKARAEENLKRVGLLSPNSGLPDSLQKVGNKKLTKAATGLSTSLGANFLVFVDYAAEQTLIELKSALSQPVRLIDEVLCLRGHSNERLEQPLSADVAQSLKQQAYRFIQFLRDFSYGQ